MNPYLTAEGVVGIFFCLFCAFLVGYHINRTKKFQPVDFTIFSMGLVYGGLLPVVFHSPDIHNFPGFKFIVESQNLFLVHTVAAFVAVIAVYVGWNAVPRTTVARFSSFFQKSKPRKIVFWLYVMTATAFVTQYLYTKDYGGFMGYFDFNRLVRAGLFDLFERSRFSYLRPFGGMVILACYGFWGLLLTEKRSPTVWAGFSISFAFSVYVLLASAGRVGIATFFGVFVMSIMLVRSTHPRKWFIMVPLMIPVSLFVIFVISDLLQLKAADNVFYFIAREAAFIFTSFFAQLIEGYHFGLFAEVFLAPAYLLPSSMTTSWLWTAADLNTEIIMGGRKGTDDITAGIPVDMLTFGLMQLHFLGVAMYAFLFGYFLKSVTAIAGSFHIKGLSAAFTAYVVIRIAIIAVFYAFPQHIISGNFSAIAVILGAIGLGTARKFLPNLYRSRST